MANGEINMTLNFTSKELNIEERKKERSERKRDVSKAEDLLLYNVQNA